MVVDWALIGTAAAQQADGSVGILSAGAHTFVSVPRESLPPANQQMLAPGAAGTGIQLTVVARLQVNRAELSQPHKMDITVMDADGGTLLFASQPLVVNNDPNIPPGWHIPVMMIFGLGLAFYRRYGEHSIAISIDGDLKKSLSFRIVPAPMLPTQQPPPPTSEV